MYFEDADLSRRLRVYGQLIYHPKIFVYHAWKRDNTHSLKGICIFLMSMIKYYKNGDELMIDILLASYNGSKYIGEQIESIIAQTNKEWKLMIHDDGSVDDTVCIVQGNSGCF